MSKFKLTMISKNLRDERYVSETYHKNGNHTYTTYEEAKWWGDAKVSSSKKEHIMNFIDYTIEEIAA